MELPIIILLWALVPLVILVGLMLIAYIGAMTDLAKARAQTERNLHG